MDRVMKKCSLSRYFKGMTPESLSKLSEIVAYYKEHNDLPFEYQGTNWLYDTMCERQKRFSVVYSQYICPEETADQLAALADNWEPADMRVLNACCGIGQLVQAFIKKGYMVDGFDIDPEMVNVCEQMYDRGGHYFYKMDYLDPESFPGKGNWDLIVAYPPFEAKLFYPFLDWLSRTLSVDGTAILLMPKNLPSSKNKNVPDIVARFQPLHVEGAKQPAVNSKQELQIFVLQLTEDYKHSISSERIQPVKKMPVAKEIPVKKEEAIPQPVEEIQSVVSEVKKEVRRPEITLAQYLVMEVPLDQIKPSPFNPRTYFDEEKIRELAASMKKEEAGLISPILLNRKEGYYQIISGERRYHAARHNQDQTIPAFIREISDEEALQLSLIENIQRVDLNPIEEALSIQRYKDEYDHKPEEIAARVGHSLTYIRGRLSLLALIEEHKKMVAKGTLSLAKAMVITCYPEYIQQRVFEAFTLASDQDWLRLSATELRKRIESSFSKELDQFSFDKTECMTCKHNAANYNLFADMEVARCLNTSCLEKKKTAYYLFQSKKIKESYQTDEIYVCPLSARQELEEELPKHNLKVEKASLEVIPKLPVKPDERNYKDKSEYNKAIISYNEEMHDYSEERDLIEKRVRAGELKVVPYLIEGEVREGLRPVEKEEIQSPPDSMKEGPAAQPPKEVSIAEQIEKVKRESTQAQKILLKEWAKDVTNFMRKQPMENIKEDEFDQTVLLFVLASTLRKEHYTLFNLENVSCPMTEDEMFRFSMRKPTEEQMNILLLDFMANWFLHASGGLKREQMMIRFAQAHWNRIRPMNTKFHNKIKQEKAKGEATVLKLQQQTESVEEINI